MTILGLDVGTNSIGWALIDETKETKKLIQAGVRIFSDGRNSKDKKPLNEERRIARGTRRNIDRRVSRKKALIRVLQQTGLLPKQEQEIEQLEADFNPYLLRKRGLDEEISLCELGRIFLHLNSRRGFLSNRKVDKEPDEKGMIIQGEKALHEKMEKMGARTLGEFLANKEEGETKRIKRNRETDLYDFYPQRQDYIHEFNLIWDKQKTYHADILNDETYIKIYRVIFFQRPLKEQAVGVCFFNMNEKRLAKWTPLFMEFVFWQNINHLRINEIGKISRALTREERELVLKKIHNKKTVTFNSLRKLLKLSDDEDFNTEEKSFNNIPAYVELAKETAFGEEWYNFSIKKKTDIINLLVNEENEKKLFNILKETYKLNDENARNIMKINFPTGYGRLGQTAISAILENLKQDVITYDKAAALAGYEASIKKLSHNLERLPYYGKVLSSYIPVGTQNPNDNDEVRYGKITNPTVHIGLGQLRKLVNRIIETYGRPDRINIELGRELKMNNKDKQNYIRTQRKNKKENDRRKEEIRALGYEPNYKTIQKLRFYEEINEKEPQERKCLYCGKNIPLKDVFTDATNIDHILPRSRSNDDAPSNQILVHQKCNQDKGNKTPFEKWGHDTDFWNGTILPLVKNLPKNKQWRFMENAMERFEDKDGHFEARQLIDTQYLSRIASLYLETLYPDDGKRHIYAITGKLTAMLRATWNLNKILSENNKKNRLDHRHHAVDAIVIALTTPSMVQQANKARSKKNFELWKGFFSEIQSVIQNVNISHRLDRDTNGKLFNETAYGRTKFDNKVVTRRSIFDIEKKDVKHIVAPYLRQVLSRFSEKNFQKELMEWRKEDKNFRNINRVRMYKTMSNPNKLRWIKDKNGLEYKGFESGGIAFFDIWEWEGKWIGYAIAICDINNPNYKTPRPHPTAKKVMRLYHEDTIRIINEEGEIEYLKCQKFASSGVNSFVRIHEAGSYDKREKDENDNFKWFSKSVNKLREFKAQKVHIDILGNILEPKI